MEEEPEIQNSYNLAVSLKNNK